MMVTYLVRRFQEDLLACSLDSVLSWFSPAHNLTIFISDQFQYCLAFPSSYFITDFTTNFLYFSTLSCALGFPHGSSYFIWLLYIERSRDSSVGIALGYGLDDRGSRVRFLASRTVLVSTQPAIQWVLGALSLGVKRPGREADHSPPSSAEVKEWVELYLHFPIRLRGMVLS
jgi:hypothetical protein